MYLAEALHDLCQYEKAELTFKKALQYNKSGGSSTFQPPPGGKEDDFYCKLAVTQMQRKNYQAALQSLLTIPAENRTLKVQVLLIRVNIKLGNPETLADIRELLKKTPLALEFLPILLHRSSLNPSASKDLVALIQKSLTDLKMTTPFYSWIVPWVKLKVSWYFFQ